MEDNIPYQLTYRPMAGYALRQAVTARVHVRPRQDITADGSAKPSMRAMVVFTALLLASDGFDGFCLVDQLSDFNVTAARVMGAEILSLPAWGWVCLGLLSLWIGYKTHPGQPLWHKTFWFGGRLRRLCRFGAFGLAALACVAGHVSLKTIY
ncbi:hypothetical protein [Acetobacter sp. LMG 32666]|uniref:hypothetical protein n=1 Tax=Acetobacter sp. LMG 32666 TaxID=2959295 RepID=UPI0030C89751